MQADNRFNTESTHLQKVNHMNQMQADKRFNTESTHLQKVNQMNQMWVNEVNLKVRIPKTLKHLFKTLKHTTQVGSISR